MTDYKEYINALRKCAKEHEGDKTFTGQIIVSNLCQDVANLLEELEQEPKIKLLSAAEAIQKIAYTTPHITYAFQEDIEYMEDAGFKICEVENEGI